LSGCGAALDVRTRTHIHIRVYMICIVGKQTYKQMCHLVYMCVYTHTDTHVCKICIVGKNICYIRKTNASRHFQKSLCAKNMCTWWGKLINTFGTKMSHVVPKKSRDPRIGLFAHACTHVHTHICTHTCV